VCARGAAAVFAVIDKLDRQPRDVSREKLLAAGLSADAAHQLLDLRKVDSIDALRSTFGGDAQVVAALDVLDRLLGHLDALGVADWVDVDLTIVRGLAYYTGTVFELFDAKGDCRAICGGGRYDNLLASLSGVDLPALGFGMGDVVLGELLRARGKLPTHAAVVDYWVAYEDAARQAEAMRVATALRRRGSSVEYALRPASLAKQLDAARKAGALAAVILRADGTMRRKELGSGVEEPFTLPHG
jgi:histidyl-tRNA synthetase